MDELFPILRSDTSLLEEAVLPNSGKQPATHTVTFRMEHGLYLIILLLPECHYLPLSVDDKAQRHRLYPSGRKFRLDLSPQHR